MARADADKLRQVFWNICDNALKAMPQGGTLTAEIADAGGPEVRILLSDTGTGLTESQREKIFEPFQAGFSNGTGLGLAIVYQIIQAHHGSIQVNSARGKGTQFAMTIPRAQAS